MIFEDICLTGYKNVSKATGLDYNHLKVALKKLAVWHAITASMILDVSLSFNLINYYDK